MSIDSFKSAFESRVPARLAGQPRRSSQAGNGERVFLQYDWVGGPHGAIAFVRLQLLPRHPELWIASLEVHPFHRGRGIGSTLVDAIEFAAASQGTPLLRLIPRSVSIPFWRRHGFKPERGCRNFSKRLAASALVS